METWKRSTVTVDQSYPQDTLQWGHVDGDVEETPNLVIVNPAASLQWGHVDGDVEESHCQIEPMGSLVLQWGHVDGDVEEKGPGSSARGIKSGFNGATSMETWKSHERDQPTDRQASFNGATSMETWKRAGCRSAPSVPYQLQWGHVDGDVEEGTRSRQTGRDELSFNGATSMETWKSGHAATSRSGRCLLQWGHVDGDVEED